MGCQLDLGILGYLCYFPVYCFWGLSGFGRNWLPYILNIYFGICRLHGGISFVLNLGLYPYWNFPLDSTPAPLFTSPKDALAECKFPLHHPWRFWQFLFLPPGVFITGNVKKKTYRSRYTSYGFGDCRGGRRSSYDSDIERHR